MLEALDRHGMEVMYAREKHGNTGDAEEWKKTAFSSLVRSSPQNRVSRLPTVFLGAPPPSSLLTDMAAACAEQVAEAPDRPHLLSIGDSEFERNAAHYAAKTCSVSAASIRSVKTVKFIDPWEGPTISQLRAQLRRLTEALQETSAREGSIDFAMEFSGTECTLASTYADSEAAAAAGGAPNASARGETSLIGS